MKYEFVEKLMNTKFRLYGIESKNPNEIKEHFKLYGRYSGQAVYIWEVGHGLVRTDATHIVIPNTQTATQVLKHIKAAKYQATYVLVGFNDFVNDFEHQTLLTEIAKAEGVHKSAVMVDGTLELSNRLSKYTFETKKLAQQIVRKAA